MMSIVTGVLVVIAILFIFLGWMLFMPVILFVDTDEDKYVVKQRGIFRVSAHLLPQPQWELRIAGFKVRLSQKTIPSSSVEKPVTTERKKKRTALKKSIHAWWFLFHGIMKSFKLRSFRVDVDTDDVALNARLIPVMLLASRGAVSMTVNFQGRVYVNLEVEARLYKMVWTFIKFLTKK